MWTTFTKSATLTIRADKFCFRNDFYISIVMLPPDDEACKVKITDYGEKCQNAPTLGNKLDSTRRKLIGVKLDLVMKSVDYVGPIVYTILILLGIIILSCVSIRTKPYGVELDPEDEVDAAQENQNDADQSREKILLENKIFDLVGKRNKRYDIVNKFFSKYLLAEKVLFYF